MIDDKTTAFVDYVIKVVNENKGFGARLRKADNDATEYQVWDILSRWVDLERRNERKSYALIGASLARIKPTKDGKLSIGEALRLIHFKENPTLSIDQSSISMRFRRILACKDQEELISVLRPTFRFIESKDLVIDYSQLLKDISFFNNDKYREWTRAKWAKHFYKTEEVV
jgi:CRISPR system Cascade subunit CasB